MFRTRLPVAINCIATVMLPLDLHVLSLPLAFILSQDQTLHCKCCLILTVNNSQEKLNVSNRMLFAWLTLLFYPDGYRSKVLLFPNFQRSCGFLRFAQDDNPLLSVVLPCTPFFKRECKGKRLYISTKFFFDVIRSCLAWKSTCFVKNSAFFKSGSQR